MKCYFCKKQTAELFYHFRAVEIATRVFGICDDCFSQYGSHSNGRDVKEDDGFRFTDEYKKNHPLCENKK